tara:strand:+ start:668 stop:880 length:213 start_codon:yes stop_codon:yes gene_type:complete
MSDQWTAADLGYPGKTVLKFDEEYLVPKCPKHKRYMKICHSTSKRYPQTLGFYCEKCGDDLVEIIKAEEI